MSVSQLTALYTGIVLIILVFWWVDHAIQVYKRREGERIDRELFGESIKRYSLRAVNAEIKMKKALKALAFTEWIDYRNQNGSYCPCCYQDKTEGHADDCLVGYALKEAKKEHFVTHLNESRQTVKDWPAWKQNILGGKEK